MTWYRMGKPGADAAVNFRGKGGPAPCQASALDGDNTKWGKKCFRLSVARCDAVVGKSLAGDETTCDLPVCEKHRIRGGTNVDYCPRHADLAPAAIWERR